MPIASHPTLSVSRSLWMRLADASIESLHAAWGGVRSAWHRTWAAHRRAQEVQALRALSPSVLRDIGLPHELSGELRFWQEQDQVLRDSVLRR